MNRGFAARWTAGGAGTLAVGMVLYLCLCSSGGGAFIYFQFCNETLWRTSVLACGEDTTYNELRRTPRRAFPTEVAMVLFGKPY